MRAPTLSSSNAEAPKDHLIKPITPKTVYRGSAAGHEPNENSGEHPSTLERISACTEELERIDFNLIAATQTGAGPPLEAEIFGALSEAAIACADAIEEAADNPIPMNEQQAVVAKLAIASRK